MSTQGADIETLLSRALRPIDPPDGLSSRLEQTLVELTEMAVDELEGWELSAMRDPRNWVRPVVATAVGATAGTALVVLRVRAQHKKRRPPRNHADLLERTISAAAAEARKLLRRE